MARTRRCTTARRPLAAPLVVMITLVVTLIVGTERPAHADADDPVDRARYELIAKLVGARQYRAASVVARMLVADNPKWTGAWVLLGHTYAREERTRDLAVEAFEKAQKLDKNDPEPLKGLAGVASARQQNDKAANFMLEAARLDEDDLELQVAAARAAVAARRMEEAKQRYDVVLDSEPDNVNAVSGFGALLVETGEYSRAIEIYQRALDKGSQDSIIFNNVVDALVRASRYEEAVEYADQALAVYPRDGIIAMHRARALIRLGRLDEAITDVEKTLESGVLGGEQAVFGWYLLGVAEALRGCGTDEIESCSGEEGGAACCVHVREALTAFEKAYSIRSDFKDTVIHLGLAQFAAGRLEDAEATLKTYIETKGDKVEAEAFGALAVTLYRFGEDADVDEAVRMYREARELAPDFDSDERLVKFRQWPPFAVATIAKLRELADERDQAAGGRRDEGCSCAVSRARGPRSGGAMASLVLVLLGSLWLRRRRRDGDRHA